MTPEIIRNKPLAILEIPCIKEYEDFVKKYGFEVKINEVNLHSNGFISVNVGWKAKKNEYVFKYATLGCLIFAYAECGMELTFPEAKVKKWGNFSFEVRLVSKNGKVFKYSPEFFENCKYQAIIWFTPQGWEDWDNAIKL